MMKSIWETWFKANGTITLMFMVGPFKAIN